MLKNVKDGIFILGGGITGLTTGWVTGLPIFEAADLAGGICSSYYIRPGENRRLHHLPSDGEAYRFEVGGGHWIFGGDAETLAFLKRFVSLKSYHRRSAVYFPKKNIFVPYPIQNNMRLLDKSISDKAMKEIKASSKLSCFTMKGWLEYNFGKTLCKLFFSPFHNLYTAGLYDKIAPQDTYKSPGDIKEMIRGMRQRVVPVGYNIKFVYPKNGLGSLVAKLTAGCQIYYKKCVVKIDVEKRKIYFQDGTKVDYRRLISTLPLNRMIQFIGLRLKKRPDPYTSVLVLNIGASKGNNCPKYHWLYVPQSLSGFHRIGFYSNVDKSFLPKTSQKTNDKVGIYVERSCKGGKKPPKGETEDYILRTIKELRAWGFIKEVEVVDSTWIDVAYTWKWPNSEWRQEAINVLKAHNIQQIGRYGKWHFQGIAESMREGLTLAILK
ncbi:MAG: FAD-dependent oxidoreductase [Candidatus Omnitrophica bacterium]|nr:FAD-dependent oxidoreductase [Candidatus Omnitrophota bacterium]